MVLRNTGLWLVVWVHQDGLKNGAVIGESTGLPAGAISGSPIHLTRHACTGLWLVVWVH